VHGKGTLRIKPPSLSFTQVMPCNVKYLRISSVLIGQYNTVYVQQTAPHFSVSQVIFVYLKSRKLGFAFGLFWNHDANANAITQSS
jgi:hypothetical protein